MRLFIVIACSILSLSAPSFLSATEIPAAQPKAIKAAAGNNNDFALALLKKLAKTKESQGKNIFLSPYSISTALAMTYAGARGNTAKEMGMVLRFASLKENIHEAFYSLAKEINKSNKRGCRLFVANALWGQKNYGFREAFLRLVTRYYAGGFNEVDFENETEKSRKRINYWVWKHTGDKIEELIEKGDIDSLTRLVLTNAIYFKGDWAFRFDKKLTRQGPFHTGAGKVVDVQMMLRGGEFLYGEPNEKLQILELPYKGGDLSMVILLPREGVEGIETLISSERNLRDWLSGMEKREVAVFVPKFRLQCKYYLKKTLRGMGIHDAFSNIRANFSGMDGTRRLYIYKVIHQADIDVNEEGTEAAAATAVVMRGKSVGPMPVIFKADHPFIFLVRHRATGSILFLGRVMNPNM